jgi:hypothetical protein
VLHFDCHLTCSIVYFCYNNTEGRHYASLVLSFANTASTLIHQRPMGLDIHHTPPIHATSLRPSPTSDDRPSLPSIGLNISRPSSRLSTASTRSLSSGYYEAARHNLQLPGLSALASIAANTPPPERQSYVDPFSKSIVSKLLHPRTLHLHRNETRQHVNVLIKVMDSPRPPQMNFHSYTPSPSATPSSIGSAPVSSIFKFIS